MTLWVNEALFTPDIQMRFLSNQSQVENPELHKIIFQYLFKKSENFPT